MCESGESNTIALLGAATLWWVQAVNASWWRAWCDNTATFWQHSYETLDTEEKG